MMYASLQCEEKIKKKSITTRMLVVFPFHSHFLATSGNKNRRTFIKISKRSRNFHVIRSFKMWLAE